MRIKVDLSKIDVEKLFTESLESDSHNLFLDLRTKIQDELAKLISNCGLKTFIERPLEVSNLNYAVKSELNTIDSLFDKLDFRFCAGYGSTEYSCHAINYQHGLTGDMPTLETFRTCKNLSIGNILVPTESIDIDIQLVESQQLKIVGFSYDIAKRKRKSYFALIGVHFSKDLIDRMSNLFNSNGPLVEIRLGYNSYPIFFISKYSGKLFSCSCFEHDIDWQDDFYRFSQIDTYPELKKKLKEIEFLNGICHLCTMQTPELQYGSEMYYSRFLQKHLPYLHLKSKQRDGSIFVLDKTKRDELENELREYFGYPKIGEKWISETALYNIVKELHPNFEVVFHYRGKELNGLELDIWIPELNLAIEYQGEQHYKSIQHWGGKEGLKKRQQNDALKKQLCQQLGYRLIEFRFDEPMNKGTVQRKINRA